MTRPSRRVPDKLCRKHWPGPGAERRARVHVHNVAQPQDTTNMPAADDIRIDYCPLGLNWQNDLPTWFSSLLHALPPRTRNLFVVSGAIYVDGTAGIETWSTRP